MAIESLHLLEGDNKYLALVKEYYKLSQKKRAIEQKLKSLKEEINSHLKFDKLNKVEINSFRITLTYVIAKRFYVTKFKKEERELYENYLAEYDYEKLTVSVMDE